MRLHGSTLSAEQISRTFTSFGLGDLPRFPSFSAPQSYPSGVTLFRQDHPSQDVFFLELGLLKLLRLEPDGQELIVGLRASGWFVGAAAAILGMPYAVAAITATACRISRLRADEFRKNLGSDPALSWRVHEMHSREIYAQLVQLADLATRSARQRLEQFLTRLAQYLPSTGTGREIWLEIPLRQWELAQLLAITPQYLCQLIGEMEREGVLRREREIVVLSPRHGSVVSVDRRSARRDCR